MDDSGKPVSSVVGLSIVFLVFIGGMAMFATIRFRNRPEQLNNPGLGNVAVQKMSRQESLELLSLRDRAIGELENLRLDEADQLLQEIVQRTPGDAFGSRNLTICRQLMLEKLDPIRDSERFGQILRQVNDAAEKLSAIETDSHIPHLLKGRVALKEGNLQRAAMEFRRATEIAPQSAPSWYELFILTPVSPGEPPAKETVEALRNVYELEPDNLFVLKDWLPLQAQLKDPGLLQTIARAKETLGPFADVIKINVRIDVREMLDKLAKAVEDGQWQIATSTAMTIRNVIVSEAARDERYVHLNSLEYVLMDYGPSFYDRADLAEPSEPTIPVWFRRTAENGSEGQSNAQSSITPKGAQDVACADFNLDGKLDVAALVSQEVVIATSTDTPADNTVKLEIGDGYSKILAVDLDDDVDPALKDRPEKSMNCPMADPDLVVFGPGGIRLFENSRNAQAVEFREQPTGDVLGSLRDVAAIVPGDFDLDGDLDFSTISPTGIRIWSNRGNWSFEEITSRSILPSENWGPTAAVLVDWDRDTDVDLLVAGQKGFGVLENLRHGRFRWRRLEGEFFKLIGSTSLLVEQIGNRPSWSVIGAGSHGLIALTTETTAAGVVAPKSVLKILETSVEKLLPLDFDNDGFRDLLVVDASAKKTLLRGTSSGIFEQFQMSADADSKSVWDTSSTSSSSIPGQGAATDFNDVAIAVGDVDRDGDEDLFLGRTGEWITNEGGNANGWLNVSLVAVQIKLNEQNYSRRVNHSGIGSTIEIKNGSRYQSQVVQGAVSHFGLGSRKSADVMRVLWTNGIPQNYVSPTSNQWICEDQKLHGSCPYLYTWDGEKFVFYTDLLWNAPLGLKFAEDVIVPWREWEYLKVDGASLQSKDGQYRLRVTAELWEIEYFDEIKLFAIDHPAGTQIFTNEKVGPASIAEHKIHTVSKANLPIAACDSQGHNILDQVRARDGVFTRTFDRKLAQGLTTEHYLELDLGNWPIRQHGKGAAESSSPVVTLFLTGWMYPGSTSLSVQHSQNPDQNRQRPPALHAVDSNGQWREVRPFLGFPGGKTKTIAVDISDVFQPDSTDYRLRIVTNMEFYWDAAFFTVDDQPVEFRQLELPLTSAHLADRGGVSDRQWPSTGYGPELFNYNHLISGDSWPPIDGKFTRFGDVHSLLTVRDDHLVVMHPGDEIQLTFAEPAEGLPEGWVRDFVIYNVGWDKDCDLNTVYGETSEPLPFREMTTYAHRNGEARPQDDSYVHYLKTYQTRSRARAPFWNKILSDRQHRPD